MFSKRIADNKANIGLIQEPYVYKGQVRCVNIMGGALHYCKDVERPRTCVLVNNIKAYPIPGFCKQDLVAVRMKGSQFGTGHKDIVVCSVYLPYDSPDPPPSSELAELVIFCRENNFSLIIGCDANAHNLVWGSSDTNDRGRALLEYITSTDLQIINRGSIPTFFTPRRKQVIDISLCSLDIASKARDWCVLQDESLSDHRHIQFNFDCNVVQDIQYRNPRSTDWNLFCHILTDNLNKLQPQPEICTEIESQVINLTGAIITAYEASCPLRTRSKRFLTSWWTPQLENLRKQVNRRLNKAKRNNLTVLWDEYKTIRRKFKSRVKKAKREAWKAYCGSIVETAPTARFHRILSKASSICNGPLLVEGERFSSTEEQAIRLLISKHMPGALEIDESYLPQIPQPNLTEGGIELAKSIVSEERIIWAIKSFSPYKSPGVDKIMPVMLQEGMYLILNHLRRIFLFCISHQVVPDSWRRVRVIFIPKQGKPDFTQTKSYRPITLTSFFLKVLERLVDRFVRDNLTISISKFQYAYQAGKSCDAALHHLVRRIEGALDKKQLALGLFMDIEGAFNCVPVESICQGAQAHGVHPILVGWFKSMLSMRIARVERNDCSITVAISKGCPQGGVLSPLFWCLVADGLLESVKNEGFYIQAFADDIVILVLGKFVSTVFELAQTALSSTERWCKNNSLGVNPIKTTVVPFTRKRNLQGAKDLLLGGTILQISNSVKYLGVILDKKLLWNEHMQNKVSKALSAFWVCRRAIGTTWGLQPKTIFWIYTTMVRPMLVYACIVWWPRVSVGIAQKNLEHLQRTICVGILSAMRTAPTRALEALLDIPPLHMFIQFEAMYTAYRLHCAKSWLGYQSNKGHEAAWKALTEMCPAASMVQDYTVPEWNFIQSWNQVIPSRKDWEPGTFNKLPTSGKDVWYTDGSRMAKMTGAGIYCSDPCTEISISLGQFATVFQAEVYAILACTQVILRKSPSGRKIYICSDSQAAIKALALPKLSSKLLIDCKLSLNELAMRNTVSLIWVPGHCGVAGNEKVDLIAKEGSSLVPITPEPILGIPKCLVKTRLKLALSEQFQRLWNLHKDIRQSKLFISGPSHKNTQSILALNRRSCHLLTGILTGHCRLRRHLNILGLVSSPRCRLCGEADETPYHLLSCCPALCYRRWLVFGLATIEVEMLKSLSYKKILDFWKYIDSLFGRED